MKTENYRILTIDDNEAIHEDYRKVLCTQNNDNQLQETAAILFGEDSKSAVDDATSRNYEVDSALQGQEGVKLIEQSLRNNRPYSCAFVDVRMPPGWDGVETTKRIWEIDPNLPVVLCTAYSDHSWEEIVRELYRTDQLLILKKPFDTLELQQIAASQVAKWSMSQTIIEHTVQLEENVRQRTEEIFKTRDLVFFALARLAESRDPETGEHLERIERYTRILVQWLAEHGPYQNQIDNDYCNQLCRSSILHDIGKVGIPDDILLKPGPLTEAEFEVMKTHTLIGAEALEDSASKSMSCEFLEMAAEIARFHHERFDGTGYPEGRSGQDIPLSARIVAVADVFDALTSERVYKEPVSAEQAKSFIQQQSNRHFDPAVVDALMACWQQFVNLAQRNSQTLDDNLIPTCNRLEIPAVVPSQV